MKFSHFKYSPYSNTIRIEPQNYLLCTCKHDWQRILDFDHAISTDILTKVIECMKNKEHFGSSHKSFTSYLNETFGKHQCISCGEMYEENERSVKNFCTNCAIKKR
jgi:hypothetical protein